MIREFIFTKPFLASWSAMGLDNESLKMLEHILLKNPKIGDVIQGTGGARKMRIQLDGRGKSGGGRVVYLDVFEKEKLYLLFFWRKRSPCIVCTWLACKDHNFYRRSGCFAIIITYFRYPVQILPRLNLR